MKNNIDILPKVTKEKQIIHHLDITTFNILEYFLINLSSRQFLKIFYMLNIIIVVFPPFFLPAFMSCKEA